MFPLKSLYSTPALTVAAVLDRRAVGHLAPRHLDARLGGRLDAGLLGRLDVPRVLALLARHIRRACRRRLVVALDLDAVEAELWIDDNL